MIKRWLLARPLIQIIAPAELQAGEITRRGLVVASGGAPPCLQLVDQAFDGVVVFAGVGVVCDGSTALAALLLAIRGLVDLLRDDRLDVAFVQVGAVAAGRVGLGPRRPRRPPLPFSRPRNGVPGLPARHDLRPQSMMIEKVVSPGSEALADR